MLSLPQEHCQQQGRPASASFGKPAAAHDQASNMVPVQEHSRLAVPVPAEQVYDPQLGASDEATAPFAEHQAQHSNAGGTSKTEAVQDGNLVSSAEPRLPMHVDQMANVSLLTDKAASQDAQRAMTVPPQSLQAPLLSNKSQWMPTPHAQPLPAWPHGPAQHATGNAVPQWSAQQTAFDVSQANLSFGSALSFGNQPCAVMW